ncbi:ATP-binding protein [Candidatus Micrarchaeota archaeon]|nr:ATP-binding protein [Candidatus Micrarchaeota archaeon]
MDFETLLFQNPRWAGKGELLPGFKRRLFAPLLKNMGNKLILSVTGLRRVGKSILLKQLADELVGNGVNPREIMYFSFDNSPGEPSEAVMEWAKKFSLDYRNKRLYVFLDEIEKVGNWGEKLKLLYDNTQIKFIISGSASMLVRKGSESLAGRILEHKLDPLSFDEYAQMRGIRPEGVEWPLYEEYLHKQFPELAATDVEPSDYVRSIADKVICEDLPKLYDAVSREVGEKIFRIIARSPGQIIESSDIAKDLGVNRESASKYLDALASSYLVRKVYNYAGNTRKSERSAKKYYPYCANLCDYMLPVPVEFSLIAETDVAFQLNAEYFSRDGRNEIDFIVGRNLDAGVEVKMRKTIDAQDAKGLLNTRLKLKRRSIIGFPHSKKDIPKGISFVELQNTAKEINPIS